MQFLIRAYDGEGKLDKRMEVRPRHLEGMKKLSENINVVIANGHFAKLGELKAEYVENTEFMKFSAEQV